MSGTRPVEAAQAQLFEAGVGAREKYQRLVVGRSGWGALLAYELVNLIAQWVPGALGLALRKTMYPWLLGACGRGVVFGQHVTLRHPHRMGWAGGSFTGSQMIWFSPVTGVSRSTCLARANCSIRSPNRSAWGTSRLMS